MIQRLARRFQPMRFDLLAIALLIGLWALGNWRALTPNTVDQWSIRRGDFSAHSLVYSNYAAERLSKGEIPLWWASNYGGQPFFADPEAAAAYPLRWLMIALSRGAWGYGTLQAEAMLHLLMASLFMYACARMLGAGYVGGVAAAVVFAHGGLLNGYPVQQLHILETIVWLPLVIALIQWSARRDHASGLILAGAALGLGFLAGHTQTALYMVYAAVAYLVFTTREKPLRVIAINVALLGLVTFLISAVSLLPAAEFLPRTTRDTDFDFAAKSSGFSFGGLIDALYPGVVALFSPLYAGIATWLLAAAGVTRQRFWAGVALLSGLFALGGNSILFSAAYWALPGVSLFRDPERAIVITLFALALLSGFGVRAIIAGDISRRVWRYLIGGSATLAVVTLLVAVVVTIALLINAAGDPAARLDIVWYAALLSAATLILALLARGSGRGAVIGVALAALVAWDLLSWTTTHPVPYQHLPASEQIPRPAYLDQVQPGAWRIDGARGLTPYASLYDLQDVYGVSPLRLNTVARLLELPVDRFWELFAVRYVTSEHDSLPAPSQRIAEADDEHGHFFVYELEAPRPYAWLVYQADVNDNPAFARQIIADSRFDPREQVILGQTPPLTLPDERPANASAQITVFEPEDIEIAVDTPENAILTLALPNYPGWQATVDGESVAIEQAYTALSAVAVPAGQHSVALRFLPISVLIGAVLSITGWLIVLISAIRQGIIQRRLRQ